MENPLRITRNGQTVECFGEWLDDSNASAVFEDEWLDGIWADGATCWAEVVEELTYFAARQCTVLIELTAC